MSDTSAKAVERLFKLVAMHGDDADAATLRALLAERDELLRDARQLQEGHNAAWERYSALASELFSLRAERDRLQAGLLRVLQYEKKCDQTGKACDAWRGCACSLEAETWCDGGGT
jgi:uncharacterized coiled-coil DUF342 family protein